MKRSQIRNLIALAAISALALGAAGGWFAATLLAVEENPAFFWSGSALIVLFVVGALYAIHRFMRAFLLDVRALAEAGRLLLGPNPERRVVPRGHPDVADLATVFNSLADRYVELQGERASEIRQARADLEEERNQLAALMSELTEGVLVCNLDGQILLYNRGARSMLDGDGTSYVGLGRSVFGVIDRSAIAHALEQVQVRYQRREGEAGARPVMTSFVTASARGRLLRTRLAPFANQAGDLRGYVVTLQDMSEGIERSSRRDALLQTLTERMRAAVGAIRAAIEAVESFPEMATAQRHRFQQVIYEESQSLSAQLDQTMRSYASDLRAQWRLEDIHATDLIWAIEHHLADRLHCEVVLDAIDDRLWVKIDSYTLVQGITYLVMQLQEAFAVVRVKLCLVAVDRHAALDICWPAEQGDADMWGHWKDRLLVTDDSDGVVTLREVADRHGGEVWFQYDGAARHAYFRLLLPRASDQESPRTAASVPAPVLESRPEYYDF
ncbi:MAG: PAS domain-containing protein, partial [Caldilineaceae bacterium]|nr:PAS domain-containing protein [Caldilineaceae bacterium]